MAANASPSIYCAPPFPSRKSHGIPTPKPSFTAPAAVGTPNAISKSSKPPTFSPPPLSPSRPKASKPSAITTSTPTNPAASPTKPIAALVQPPPEKSAAEPQPEIPLIPAPTKTTARAMRPLWRDLILSVWGTDPLKCPCCQGTMRRVETIVRPEDVEFFLRLLGLWEPKRSGDRLPTGSPKGGASATSTFDQPPATARATFRH